MAAITALIEAPADRVVKIRTGSAQADTGQTDWIKVPAGSRYAEVIINLTAVAGTTPQLTPSILAADPIVLDDTNVVTVASLATAQTGHGCGRILIGPGVSGIANALTWGASAGSDVLVNTVVPRLMGIKVLLDRDDSDEKYTYTVSVRFIGE